VTSPLGITVGLIVALVDRDLTDTRGVTLATRLWRGSASLADRWSGCRTGFGGPAGVDRGDPFEQVTHGAGYRGQVDS
jgi:hypothetical protein